MAQRKKARVLKPKDVGKNKKMVEKRITKAFSKVINWLVAILLSAGIAISLYYIGSYLLDYFGSNKHPELWGIPIVFLISLLCFLVLLRKFSIPFEKIHLPLINKQSSLYLLLFAVVIVLLFLTRYKIVNTQGAGFYKVDRWTGSAYLIQGIKEIKVHKQKK